MVEIKADGDTKQRNKAKYRDGKVHFDSLNIKLKGNGIDWKYHFYFLSPEDRTEFFQAIRNGRYKNWKSGLMQELSGNGKCAKPGAKQETALGTSIGILVDN